MKKLELFISLIILISFGLNLLAYSSIPKISRLKLLLVSLLCIPGTSISIVLIPFEYLALLIKEIGYILAGTSGKEIRHQYTKNVIGDNNNE